MDWEEVEQTQILLTQITLVHQMQVQTMEGLFSLFNASDKTNVWVESISNLGPRTLKHYRDWTRALRDTHISVEIEWSSSIRGKEMK
jgi:hypothetical protein